MADDPLTPETARERVRAIALALPEATEGESDGAPGFLIEGERFFCHVRHDHDGDGETVAIVRTSGVDEQAALIETDPDRYARAAFPDEAGWVSLRLLPADTDWDRIADRIAISWELVAPQRLLEAGGR